MSGRAGEIITDIVENGLVFNIDAANRASYPRTGTTATDTIGNIVGTLSGGSGDNNTPQIDTTTGSGVFDFDGTDDLIALGVGSDLNFSVNDIMSINCWVNFNSYNASSWTGVVTKRGYNYAGSGESYNIGNEGSSGKGMFWVNDGSYKVAKSNSALSNNTWYNLCGTADGNNVNLYVNGIKQSQTVSYSSITNSTSITRIGFNNEYLNGQAGPVHIYNRALSANEVLHNYNALKGRFGL